jgi:hypothetical protein
VIVTNKEKPYVLGTRLRVNRDKIAEIEILWTTTGYWLFNADAYLKWSSTEKWDTIPANMRDTRDTLVSAANAYLDAFFAPSAPEVPAAAAARLILISSAWSAASCARCTRSRICCRRTSGAAVLVAGRAGVVNRSFLSNLGNAISLARARVAQHDD